jgi:acyl-coenzyme A synthetase/AMP-(fatty) acid ligase
MFLPVEGSSQTSWCPPDRRVKLYGGWFRFSRHHRCCRLSSVEWIVGVKTLSAASPGCWVDELLLAGPPEAVVLRFGAPLDRGRLRALVADRQGRLVAAGLGAGGAVAVQLPPSIEFVAIVLAAWRAGGQVILLDDRLTDHEAAACLDRTRPRLLVRAAARAPRMLRGFVDVDAVIETWPGRRAGTDHALIQFSSGSTGPSKVIGRTAADLAAEIDRYTRIAGFPAAGEQMVVMASLPHVLGLVGGLLNGLHSGFTVVVPRSLRADGVLATLAEARTPAALLGVPSQAALLTVAADPPRPPLLRRMIVGGEPVGDALRERFGQRFGVPIGAMYGMTEAGVMATDVLAEHGPALRPAPGHTFRADGRELLLRMPRSPYLGQVAGGRWADGWLRTRDAGEIRPADGLVVVHGRLDSQVSVGGLKVDLTEVEQVLAGAPGVRAAVVVFDGAIQAYVELADGDTDTKPAERHMRERLAVYKRPRAVYALPRIPRTVSGKPVRDPAALGAARLGVAVP